MAKGMGKGGVISGPGKQLVTGKSPVKKPSRRR